MDLSLNMGFKESSKFPYVSPDNRFLFFSSGQNIYWLDSKILKITNKIIAHNWNSPNKLTTGSAQTF